MVTVTLSVQPAGYGALFLYREDGVVLGGTSGSTTVRIVKGTRGYFVAQAAPGNKLTKITVNGTTYTSPQTPIITLDRDMSATAYFEVATPPPPAGSLKIKEANHPASAQVGQETPFYFTAHVESGSIRDAGLAYIYADGPSDTITIIDVNGKGTTVWKGSRTIAYYAGDSPTCTTLDSRGSWRSVKFPAQGSYKIRLAACSNCSGEPKIEDSRDYTVEVSQAPPTAPPEEKKPPEEEKPWWERTYYGLPLWAWIAIGAGGIAAIGAVAYAEERRREELMFTLMGRR